LREIVMDTETTGFDCRNGDRLVEIGCIEVVNYIPTGRTFHRYINPERDMPEGAFAVHGLSEQFLRGHPVFADHVADFLDFIGDAKLIFHNASFDMGFINMELERVSRSSIPAPRIIDTLALARRKHPGGPNSLDALCKRYGIDNSSRTLHGALLDAQLLAEVYLQLSGGQQPVFDLGLGSAARAAAAAAGNNTIIVRPEPLPSNLIEAEIAAHTAFVDGLGDSAIWRLYEERREETEAAA
jgi:DNA polymerase III subunit epsilon